MKRLTSILGALALFLSPVPSLMAQAPVTVNLNIQAFSAKTFRAKYNVPLPKGYSAGDVVAENPTTSIVTVGQGSILLALRSKGYPALSSSDAMAVILHLEDSGFVGFIRTHAAFYSKLLGDTEGLIVSKAVTVAPMVGVAVAGASAALQSITPDIVSQLNSFVVGYSSDGLPNLVQLGPGQSATVTVVFDTPQLLTPVNGAVLPVAIVPVQSNSTAATAITGK